MNRLPQAEAGEQGHHDPDGTLTCTSTMLVAVERQAEA